MASAAKPVRSASREGPRRSPAAAPARRSRPARAGRTGPARAPAAPRRPATAPRKATRFGDGAPPDAEFQFEERKQRRSLSHVGGAVTFRGEEALRPALERALAVSSDERETRAHVHGFHSYPARLHPMTAHRLVEALSRPGATVLDPFCGSGTVLVEAVLAGRAAVGIDVNPLSILLSRVKCGKTNGATRAAILKQADLAMQDADERRRAKMPPHKLYSTAVRRWFDAHVLLELDSLHECVQRVRDEQVRDALELVFSSLLTKVSRKAGDTAPREVGKRIASGYAIRHFGDRTRELVAQLEAYARLLGTRAPTARVFGGDARRLDKIPPNSIDLVVSSPPYPGVFDYVEHHELRLQWLGLKVQGFARDEIGARRQMDRLGDKALERWRSDLSGVLRALHRVLRHQASACLVIADSVVAGEAVFADELLLELAPPLGLEIAAVASQRRPYFHRATAALFTGRPRREHVVVLRKR